MPNVAAFYHEQRDQATEVGRKVRAYLATAQTNAAASGELTPTLLQALIQGIASQFDPQHGGFGTSEGPKFPAAEALRLALAAAFLTDDATLQRAVLYTLDAYAASGMRDHLQGGFFRYSMDRALTVPHFEKMDYVQAALLPAYLDAYRLTGNAAYAEVARDIMRYVNDSLLDRARGGFSAHQDADVSMDDDGSYYTWSLAQLRATLASDLAEALLDAFQVRSRPQDLQMAERILERAIQLYWDQERGGFYDRPADPTAPALLADREKPFADTPLPGDNAVAARALDKLYLLTSQERWRTLADKTLATFAGAARQQGTFVGTYGLALQAHLYKPPQVVVMGPRQDRGTQALAAAAWRTYRPGRLVATYDPSTVALETLPPAVAGAARVFQHDATPRAYVCVGETCAPPTSAPDEVAARVRDYGRLSGR